ncbi:site-specific integrase [Flavobacterium terrigena]|uniref:Phage integrase family protein n=1 Tax=Flavobacterium terrigena TaxID=402734 RepID=A0A1H6XGE6_9FLAO|nr:site-specific integrase [Flavobacterium terrigena]SEJ26604.1 Phage integrase family protein [Flavobacterium terrigena]
MRTSGTVNFRLKESTKEEKPIFLDFSYGRNKRFKYAVGYSVLPKYWTGSEIKNVVAVRNSNQINDLLRDLKSEILNFVSDCDAKQIVLSNDVFRAHLNKFTHKNQLEEVVEIKQNLFGYFDKYIAHKSKELNRGDKSVTIRSYKQTFKHLREFEFDSGYIVDFETIDNEFYIEFVDYMNNKEYKKGVCYSGNTIGKHIKNFKTFMNSSLQEELHSNMKFKKFKVFTEQTTAIYLTLDEQKSLLDLDLSETPHHELARDVFIIGCEIGQRISDYNDLSRHTIERHENEEYIKINQQKTGNTVLCKITPAIRFIMDKRYEGKFPPKILEQKLNDYIKIVGKKAKINEKVKCEMTRGGAKVQTEEFKYNLIMGHSARRSFCTLKFKAGMPVHYIKLLSGHQTDSEFFKYIRNPKEERIAQITATKEFTDSSLTI